MILFGLRLTLETKKNIKHTDYLYPILSSFPSVFIRDDNVKNKGIFNPFEMNKNVYRVSK